MVLVLLGGCVVAALALVMRARVEIARIQAGQDRTHRG